MMAGTPRVGRRRGDDGRWPLKPHARRRLDAEDRHRGRAHCHRPPGTHRDEWPAL